MTGGARGTLAARRGRTAPAWAVALAATWLVAAAPPAAGPEEATVMVGWVVLAEDPPQEFARAVGGFWGEPVVRELPTREIARFSVKGLTEARLRALVDSLNQEFQGRDYHLEGGPSSNSFVSRLLDRLGIPLPSLGEAELPGWGRRP